MPSCNSEDFRDKQVVCVADGRLLGYVAEIEFDVCDGRITAIIVCGEGGILSRGSELLIPWEKIEKIGEDVILVDGVEFPVSERGGRGRRKGKM